MSNTIDQRILQMKFDNAQFENGVKESMHSLNQFDKTIRDTEKTTAFSSITKSIEGVSSNLSAMSIAGITAIARLTNAAINAGKKLASALTIDPLKSGFAEYQEQMNSTMVIMSNTGDDLKTVTAALDELNVYADKTVYSFGQMTTAIGKFAAAGVNLDDSVAAIKGLSNAAALVGANNSQLYSAYYNLAQSLQMGYLQTIDYNSLSNSTIMNKKMRDIMVETAIEMGKFTKESEMAKLANEDFKGSLQKKWLTSDVILAALEKYSNETTKIGKEATAAATEVKSFKQLFDTIIETIGTGWADTFKVIVGDLEEARTLFTDINNVLTPFIDGMSKARLELFKGWDSLGGRDAIIKTFFSGLLTLQSYINPIKSAFRDLFPKVTSKQLAILSNKLLEFVRSLRLTNEEMKGLKNLSIVIFTPIKILANTFKFAATTVASFAYMLFNLSRVFLQIISSGENLKEFMIEVFGKVRYSKIIISLNATLKNLSNAVSNVKREFKELKSELSKSKVFQDFINKISDGTGNIKIAVLDKIVEFFGAIARASYELKIGDISKSLLNIIEQILPILSNIISLLGYVGKGLGYFVDNMLKAVDVGKMLNVALAVLSVKGFAGITAAIIGAIRAFTRLEKSVASIPGLFKKFSKLIKAETFAIYSEGVKDLATSVAILSGSLALLTLTDTKKLGDVALALSTLTLVIGAVASAFLYFAESAMDGSGTIKSLSKAFGLKIVVDEASSAMLKMAASVMILSVSMKKLSELEWPQLLHGIIGVSAALLTLIGSLWLINKVDAEMPKHSRALLMFAGAVYILIESMQKIIDLKPEEIAKGIGGIIAIMASLTAAVTIMTAIISKAQRSFLGSIFGGNGTANLAKGGMVFVELAAAVYILTSAVTKFTDLNIGEMAKGIGGIIILLTSLTGAAIIISKFKVEAFKGAAAMLVMAAAIRVLVTAVESFGKMSIDEFNQGIEGMVYGLIALAGVSTLLSKFKVSAIGGAASMLIIAAAMGVLAIALKGFIEVTPNQILAMGSAMLVLAIGLGALSGLGPVVMLGAAAMLLGSVALIALAAALAIFTPSLKALVDLNAGDLIVTILALARGLLVLGATSAILGVLSIAIVPCAIALSALALSVMLLSPALLALQSVNLIGIAGGLLQFGTSAIVAGLGGVAMVAGAVGVGAFALALTALAGAIALLGTVLASATIIMDLFNAGVELMTNLKEGIESKIDDIKQKALDCVSGFVNGIKNNIKRFFNIGQEAGSNYVEGFSSKGGVDSHSDSKIMIEKGKDCINGFVHSIQDNMSKIFNVGELSGSLYPQGFESGLEKEDPDLSGYLDQTIIQEALANEQYLLDSGAGTANSFCDGMEMALNARGRTLTAAARSYMANLSAAEAAQFFAENKMNEDYFAIIENTTPVTKEATEATKEFGSAAGGAGKSASEAKDAFEEMRDSITSSIDVFKEFTEAETVSGDRLMANLASQIRGTEQWANSFEQLAAKGFDEKIIKKLADMGTESYGYIKGMLTMSDTYVQSYNKMFKYTEQIADSSIDKIKIALPEMTNTVATETKKTEALVGHEDNYISDALENQVKLLEDVQLQVDAFGNVTVPEATESVEEFAEANIELTESLEYADEETENRIRDFKIAARETNALNNVSDVYANTLSGVGVVENKVITITKDMVLAYIEATAKMNEAIEEWKTNLKDTISGSINIFEKFDFTAEKSAQDYVDAIETQVNAMGFYADGLNQLLAKGFDERYVEEIAKKGVDGSYEIIAGLVNATEEQVGRVNSAYQKTLDLPDTMVEGLATSFKEAGLWTVEGFATGLSENKEQIKDAFNLISTYGLENFLAFWGIHSPSTVTYDASVNMVLGAVGGIKDKQNLFMNALYTMSVFARQEVTNILNYNNFYEYGTNVGQGLIDGIHSMMEEVADAARDLANAANEAFRSKLEINSPSRIFRDNGLFMGEGAAIGLNDSTKLVTDAAENMGESAIDVMADTLRRISEVINSDVDVDPVIRPVLDLSEIQNGSSALDNMLNKSTEIAARKAGEVALSYSASKAAVETAKTGTPDTGATYNFTQNNYSPKALDRIEIYRQTNNQFSKMKGLVLGT